MRGAHYGQEEKTLHRRIQARGCSSLAALSQSPKSLRGWAWASYSGLCQNFPGRRLIAQLASKSH